MKNAGIIFLSAAICLPACSQTNPIKQPQIQSDKESQGPTSFDKEVSNLFSSSGCNLPEKLIERLKKSGQDAFVPEELKQALKQDPITTFEKVSGANVRAAMHVATFERNGKSEDRPLTGSQSYFRLDPLNLLDPGKDNFLYTIDCSGYLNSSIALGGGVPAAQGEIAAKLAMQSVRSIFVARATLFSPIAMAIHPDIFPEMQSRRDRMDILHALLQEANLVWNGVSSTEATKISTQRMTKVLWTSNNGTSSLQGKSSFDAKAGLGSIGFNAGGANSISKNLNFSSFNTYIIPSQNSNKLTIDLASVPEKLRTLVNYAAAGPINNINGDYQVAYDLPRTVCEKTWTVYEPRVTDIVAGTASIAWEDTKGCVFSVRIVGSATGIRNFELRSPIIGSSLEFSLPLTIFKQ